MLRMNAAIIRKLLQWSSPEVIKDSTEAVVDVNKTEKKFIWKINSTVSR